MASPEERDETSFGHDDDDDEFPIVDEEPPADDFLRSVAPPGAAAPPSDRDVGADLPPKAPKSEIHLSDVRFSAVPPSGPIAPPGAPGALGPVAPPVELETGSVLDDKYQILVKLGQGGMGAVFRARHKLLEKDVALKVIASQMAQDPNFKARFFREAKVAMEFVHRHAIPLRDFGVTGSGLFYMTMDYSSGVSLRALVEREGSLDPARACRIVHQMLEALAEAHRKKIIHRDLKPDNVMVEQDADGKDFVKVLDFGLAKIAGGEEGSQSPSLQSGEAILGTPAYMAPEQACGEEIDHRADIYACGIVLYQLLTGELPFKALTTRQMILKQVASVPPSMKKVKPDLTLPAGLEAVVFRALAKERAERYQDAEEFADALVPYIEGRRRVTSDTIATPPLGAAGPIEIGVGVTVDRYKILEKIAEGGFGTVFRAEHILMHRACAFKVMKPGLSEDEEFATRFQREAQVASKFKHPNAVEVYDFGKVGHQLFMAMELVEGKPLTGRLRSQEPPIHLKDAVEIVCQVLEVLESAHRGGIVHRDLKPDNIMLNEVDGWPNQVKVLDFGIAKMKDARGDGADFKTQAGSFFGTPQYSSPEQCRAETGIDGRSDLYSVGVILFEILTGKLPFESETAAGFLAAHMVSTPKRIRDVKPDLRLPEPVEAVILKALEKSRERRFQSAREFAEALKRAAGIFPLFEVGEKGVRVAGQGRAAPHAHEPVKGFGFAVAAIVLAVVAAIFIFASSASSKHGRVRIRTEPGGVSVAMSAPTSEKVVSLESDAEGILEIGDLKPGEYTAVFLKPGFERDQRTLTVEGGRTLEIAVALSPSRDQARSRAEGAREEAMAARADAVAAGATALAAEAFRDAGRDVTEGERLVSSGDFEGARRRFEAAIAGFKAAAEAARVADSDRREAEKAAQEVADARAAAEEAGARLVAEQTMLRADEDAAVGASALSGKDSAQALGRFRSALALYRQAKTLAVAEVGGRLDAERKACETARREAEAAGAEKKIPAAYSSAIERQNDAISLAARNDKLAAARKFGEAARLFEAAKAAAEDREAAEAFAVRVRAQLAELENEARRASAARLSAEAAGARDLARRVFDEALTRSTIADQAETEARALLNDGPEQIAAPSRKAVGEALEFAVRKRREARESFASAEAAARQGAELARLREKLDAQRAGTTAAAGQYQAALEAARRKPGIALGAAEAKAAQAAGQLLIANATADLALAGVGSADAAARAVAAFTQAAALYLEAVGLVHAAEAAAEGTGEVATGSRAALERLIAEFKRAYEAKDISAFGRCFGEWEGARKEGYEQLFADPRRSFRVTCEPPTLLSNSEASTYYTLVVTEGSRAGEPRRIKVTFARFGGAWKIDR